MITIHNTHTGKIFVDTDRQLEYLTVGDYGKENNIKIQYSDIPEIRAAIEHTVKNINKSNANETVFKTHYLIVHNSLDELINFYFRKDF